MNNIDEGGFFWKSLREKLKTVVEVATAVVVVAAAVAVVAVASAATGGGAAVAVVAGIGVASQAAAATATAAIAVGTAAAVTATVAAGVAVAGEAISYAATDPGGSGGGKQTSLKGSPNNRRVLEQTRIKGYRVSVDLEKGLTGENNIHALVDNVKYYYKGGEFLTKAGQRLPGPLRNHKIILEAVKKAMDLWRKGW